MQRFFDKVTYEPNSGCWLWTACAETGAGYGMFAGFPGDKRTHRISYRLHHGEIPPGLLVCHRCDVRTCVNPEHLFLGTHKDNMQDCSRKGRIQRVEALKTHCPKGHPYSPKNTRVDKRGSRHCRACHRDRVYRRRARRRANARPHQED